MYILWLIHLVGGVQLLEAFSSSSYLFVPVMFSFSCYIAFKHNDGVAADDSVTVGKDPFVASIDLQKQQSHINIYRTFNASLAN